VPYRRSNLASIAITKTVENSLTRRAKSKASLSRSRKSKTIKIRIAAGEVMDGLLVAGGGNRAQALCR